MQQLVLHSHARSNVAHERVRVMSSLDRTAIRYRVRTGWHAIASLLLLCLLARSAAAQTTATIEGTVTDTTGAVVPGATVKVSGTTLASERTATTGAEGVYRVTALPAGNYTLDISASGFATRTVPFELTLNRVLVVNVTLQVQGVELAVEVTSPLVDATTAATGTTITPRQITELPVNG